MQLWLIPILPLAGFALNGLFGRRFSKSVVNLIAVGSVFIAFLWVLKTLSALGVFAGGEEALKETYKEHYFTWIQSGALSIGVDFAIDRLTDMVEGAVYKEFEAISERGGVLGAMDTMYQRGKIQEESLYYEQKKHDGSLPLNFGFKATDGDGDVATSSFSVTSQRILEMGCASELVNSPSDPAPAATSITVVRRT